MADADAIGDDQPGQFGVRPLVCSVGLSPQVVTETLYALAIAAPRRFIPTALHLITTKAGAMGVEVALLRADGALAQMARAWNVPALAGLAQEAVIHIVPSADGDMSDEADLKRFATFAAKLIRSLTAMPDSAVHVSLSGGRKSAAAALALAMALYGRAQDRLSHVLVDEAFANHPGFFFPTPDPSPLLGPQGRILDAQIARVLLAQLPFPRLRAFAPAHFDEFGEGVEAFQAAIDRVRLNINLDDKRIGWGMMELRLQPAIKAWLAVLADDLLNGGAGIARVGTPARGFLEAYRRLRGDAAAARLKSDLADPLDPEWLEEKCSRINKETARQGARPRDVPLVLRAGARARAVYRLSLERAEVNWTGAKLAA